MLADLDTGQVLFDLDRNERRPIASVTKIMTALLVVERADLTDVVTVTEGAASGPVAGISGLGLMAGERIRVDELLTPCCSSRPTTPPWRSPNTSRARWTRSWTT